MNTLNSLRVKDTDVEIVFGRDHAGFLVPDHIICLVCGGTAPLSIVIDSDVWIRQAEDFAAEHRTCPKTSGQDVP